VLVPCLLALVLIDRACASQPADARPASASSPAGPQQPAPAYAPGACRALAPTGGMNRGRTVFIDPGHGGPDPGVTGQAPSQARPIEESHAALDVANEVAGLLRADGNRVVLSRTGDTTVLPFAPDDLTNGALSATQVREDLQARVRCANGSHAVALLSIHFNGYGDSSVGGSQTIYDAVRPFADQSQRLAANLQSALTSRLQLTDRGVLADDQLNAPTLSDRADSYGHLLLLGPAQDGWLDQGTAMPGALVEPLFLTAPREAALAASAGGQRRVALALVAGLDAYLAGRQVPSQ
jgi:N-acetylmuramoyl-L-alanine amidase